MNLCHLPPPQRCCCLRDYYNHRSRQNRSRQNRSQFPLRSRHNQPNPPSSTDSIKQANPVVTTAVTGNTNTMQEDARLDIRCNKSANHTWTKAACDQRSTNLHHERWTLPLPLSITPKSILPSNHVSSITLLSFHYPEKQTSSHNILSSLHARSKSKYSQTIQIQPD